MPETNPPADPMIVRLPLIKFYQTDDGRVVGEVTGSTPVPPGMTNGRYLSASGYTTDITQATDFRGEAGKTIVEGETVEVVGPKGEPGMNGRSAYEIWLEAGNVGSEAAFLASLKGDVGATGAKGDAGPAGASASPGFVALPDINLADGGVVQAAGIRKKTFPCAGAIVGDRLTVFAPQGMPGNYLLGDASCTTANQVTVTFSGPALVLLTNNNVTLKVVAFR